MKEIIDRLNENRQVELAKDILESKGYRVSKSTSRRLKMMRESVSDDSKFSKVVGESSDTMDGSIIACEEDELWEDKKFLLSVAKWLGSNREDGSDVYELGDYSMGEYPEGLFEKVASIVDSLEVHKKIVNRDIHAWAELYIDKDGHKIAAVNYSNTPVLFYYM